MEIEEASQRIKLKGFLARFACISLGICCFFALVLFCLQGLRFHGFDLDPGLMHWLGLATVGCVGSLALIVYKSTFVG